MQLYLFNDPGDSAELKSFMRNATSRSVKTLRALAMTALIVSVILLTVGCIVPAGLVVKNVEEFRILYLILLGNTIVFLLMLRLTRSAAVRRFLPVRILLLGYSLAVIGHFGGVSLLAQYNPSNTLTYLLTGCFTIAVLVLLSVREILFISIATYFIFIASLHFFQHDPMILRQNYITGFMIVLMMFFISRMWFSYQYDYYRQIRIIAHKNRQIQMVNTQQTEMLSIVAHDLRNPLNNIAASVDLLKMGVDQPDELYSMMEKACRDADYFIRDLIDVARTKPTPLSKAPVSMNKLIAEILQSWQTCHGMEREFEADVPDFQVIIAAHEQKLRRALDNLIHNAVKFTKEGGMIKLTLSANDETVYIDVADNGVGIPDEFMPYLFDRFTRAGRQGLNDEQSYGLGLSICKEVIAQHDGSIRVESQLGAGTTFHIILPRQQLVDQA